MSINIQESFQKMPLGEKIILPAGVILLIDSFLPWYKYDPCSGLGLGDLCNSISRSGWQSPGSFWSILAILLGLSMAALVGATRFGNVKLPALPQGVTMARIYFGGGVAALLLVIIKFLSESSHLSFGFFIGIICVIALAAGGGLLFQAERQGGAGGSTTSSM